MIMKQKKINKIICIYNILLMKKTVKKINKKKGGYISKTNKTKKNTTIKKQKPNKNEKKNTPKYMSSLLPLVLNK